MIKKVLDSLGLVGAVVSTAIVAVVVLGLSAKEPAVQKVGNKFEWCKTTVVDEAQVFAEVGVDDKVSYNDAGLKTGQSSVWLGQLVDPDAVTVLEEDGDWAQCEVLSKSLQMEVYREESGWYVQSLRTCSGFVSTIRGVQVGMNVYEALKMYPGYADVTKVKDKIQIVAGDAAILFKVDRKDSIYEISIRFLEEG